MDTIFMNSKKSKTSDPHRLLLNPLHKINLKRRNKYISLSNLIICFTWKTIKRSYENNKFKMSPTWNEESELPNGWYSVSNIQDYFEYMIKNNEVFTDNPSIMIHINKIENWITLKIKTQYHLELLMLETMKLLGSTKSKITKYENGENLPNLEITKVILAHCNFFNKDSQYDSRALYTFIHNKSFC